MKLPKPPANVMRVFISSPTVEMEFYRSRCKEAVKQSGMKYIAYDDPDGIFPSQSGNTLVELGRNAVKESDVFIGIYGDGPVWRPTDDVELTKRHPELLEDPDKFFMEYEYEWAIEQGLYIFRFARTDKTTDARYTGTDERMRRFVRKLRTTTVRNLTTPEAFYRDVVRALEGITPRVFLSYSRKDVEYVRQLQHELRKADVHAWRDEVHAQGGTEWRRAINSALKEMDALVVVVTPQSLASEWVEKECRFFIRKKKPLIPFIANADCRHKLPPYLEKRMFIDGTLSSGSAELAKRLRSIIGNTNR